MKAQNKSPRVRLLDRQLNHEQLEKVTGGATKKKVLQDGVISESEYHDVLIEINP